MALVPGQLGILNTALGSIYLKIPNAILDGITTIGQFEIN